MTGDQPKTFLVNYFLSYKFKFLSYLCLSSISGEELNKNIEMIEKYGEILVRLIA